MADLASTAPRARTFADIAPALIAAAVLALAVFGAERFGSRLLVSLLAQAVIIAMMALAVGMLVRVSGLVNFGHAAPFGLGAYGSVLAFSSASPFPPEIALPLVVLAVFAAFFLIGLVISRIEGVAFGMLTLSLGQASYVAATKFRTVTGGADGVFIEMPRRLYGISTDYLQSPNGMLVVGTAMLALIYVILTFAERTRLGRLAVAIRENEERVRFLGYRTRMLKAAVFAMSAALAGFGGAMFALYQGFVSPEILHWSFSGSALIMAILGGSMSLWGPIAGAFVFFFLKDGLTDVTKHWHAVLGATLIAVTIAWPGGISGAVQVLWQRVTGASAGGKRP